MASLWTSDVRGWLLCVIERRARPQDRRGRNLGELKARLSPHLNRLKRKEVLTLPPLRIDSWPLSLHELPPSEGTEIEHYAKSSSNTELLTTLDGAALEAYLMLHQRRTFAFVHT
jgi:hypothetical protein